MYRNLVMFFALSTSASFISESLLAQPTNAGRFGLVVGVSQSTIKGKEVLNGTEGRTGLVAGISFNAPIRPRLGLEVDALYTDRGFRIPQGTSGLANDFAVNTSYLDVPLLLTIGSNHPRRFSGHFLGGVSMNIRIRCAIENEFSASGSQACEGIADASSANIARLDIPIVYGAHIYIPVSTLEISVEARAHVGTRNIERNVDAKNRAMTFTLGIRRANVQ